MGKSENPECHLLASGIAAIVNYPLWKASAINQSGFMKQEPGLKGRISSFMTAISPPYRGVPAVIGGMTWARAAIFYGSDHYKAVLMRQGWIPEPVCMALPPLVLSSFVQFVNMPVVRASITMQNPNNYNDPRFRTTISTIRHLYETKGFFRLWHGLNAGIAKSVPKYITSVVVKDVMEQVLPPARDDAEFLVRASVKSVMAGVAGAVLTNPMDVIRNEMFKTDQGMMQTIRSLNAERGAAWIYRGLMSNLIAVSIPITVTIFLTDTFVRFKNQVESPITNFDPTHLRKGRY